MVGVPLTISIMIKLTSHITSVITDTVMHYVPAALCQAGLLSLSTAGAAARKGQGLGHVKGMKGGGG